MDLLALDLAATPALPFAPSAGRASEPVMSANGHEESTA